MSEQVDLVAALRESVRQAKENREKVAGDPGCRCGCGCGADGRVRWTRLGPTRVCGPCEREHDGWRL